MSELTLGEPSKELTALSFQEVAKKLAVLSAQETEIKIQIEECRKILQQENLNDKERIDTGIGEYVSVSPQPPFFTEAIKKELKDNDLKSIPTNILGELLINGYIEEKETTHLNEEKISELPDAERSALFEKGVISTKMMRKTIKPKNTDADDPFVKELMEANIFEEKPNHVRLKA